MASSYSGPGHGPEDVVGALYKSCDSRSGGGGEGGGRVLLLNFSPVSGRMPEQYFLCFESLILASARGPCVGRVHFEYVFVGTSGKGWKGGMTVALWWTV